MKSKLIYPMVLVVFAAGCGGRSSARNAAQQQYETVQEGSAAGVTSTIHGPGETLPPITGTNADTTTAFTLNPAAIPPAQQPAQVGGLPPAYPGTSTPPPMMSSAPPPPAPAPRPVQPVPPQPTEPQQPETEESTAPPTDTGTTRPPAEEPPPADDTSGTQAEEPPPPPPPHSLD